MVAGGNEQIREVHPDFSSPSVTLDSVSLLASEAANVNAAVATIDFPGAFLNMELPTSGQQMYLCRRGRLATVAYALIHVDSVKLLETGEGLIDEVACQLIFMYPKVKGRRGKMVDYLGISFDSTCAHHVKVGMEGYLHRISEDHSGMAKQAFRRRATFRLGGSKIIVC
ncbi:hypothetical protein FVE85_9540 [Porphyridium purpureum]|uniref:Uncharacterized protein n=1 Tax=Porphyridium purpureum TaxID=35688 RepID=A0A5J4YJC2_PORPP|nr:hypothetical protein FVE85_9540 [Porphyridium purpureum]|eukprot:POR8360..scf261_15